MARPEYERERLRLRREIETDMRECASATGRDTLSPRVIAAIETVPRHRFVPPGMQPSAYENRPLSIGLGQTISQPFIVALMTDMIDPGPDDVVLEIGTGSGYQAAVLAQLVRQVYSIETLPELAQTARGHLIELGYHNVEVRVGDGHQGWVEHAPFDAIIVTAAAPEIPPALVDQLRPGGRMVIPVGLRYMTQDLVLLTKDADSQIHRRSILPVAFVPLIGSGVDDADTPTEH